MATGWLLLLLLVVSSQSVDSQSKTDDDDETRAHEKQPPSEQQKDTQRTLGNDQRHTTGLQLLLRQLRGDRNNAGKPVY